MTVGAGLLDLAGQNIMAFLIVLQGQQTSTGFARATCRNRKCAPKVVAGRVSLVVLESLEDKPTSPNPLCLERYQNFRRNESLSPH